MTLFHREKIVENILLNQAIILIIEQAFSDLATKTVRMPPIMRIDVPEYSGEVDVKAAYTAGEDSFAIKISSGFFDNPKKGIPTANGMMLLISAETGIPQAIFADNGYLTEIRTAAAGAVAANHLSNKNSKVAGIIGTGSQARLQLQALTFIRDIEKVFVYGRSTEKAIQYKHEMEKQLGIPIDVVEDPNEAAWNSDILVTTTPSREALLDKTALHPGLHITAMGSDAEHKQELAENLIAKADLFVCDGKEQSLRLGELRSVTSEQVKQNAIELGDITSGRKIGRISEEQTTICDLTGTGIQDTAIARYTYQKLSK